jgi:Glyoxalase-like domain
LYVNRGPRWLQTPCRRRPDPQPLTFQRAADFVAPTWPDPAVQQQMHLDLAVDDIEAAHERAIALGARHLDTQERFRVYTDPVGHLFCLCAW